MKLTNNINTKYLSTMTKILVVLPVIVCLQVHYNNLRAQIWFTSKENPIVRHIYTADPAARVFDNRLYVYTSHDEDTAQYFDMVDWHVFSTDNLVDWIDHGAIFGLDRIQWAQKWAWAPDCVSRNGKYYFYFPVERSKIGVAESETPTGPFIDVIGKPLIDKAGQVDVTGNEPIDPVVLIDKEQAYMYFGCRHLRVVKLKEKMMEIDGDIMKVEIQGAENDEENFGGYFGEGPWVFKREDWYYLMYSNGWGKTSTLVYAIAKDPLGPFKFVGEVMEPVNSWTSHGSIVEFKGKWYIFYHDMTLSNINFRRSISFDEIVFDPDGKIRKH